MILLQLYLCSKCKRDAEGQQTSVMVVPLLSILQQVCSKWKATVSLPWFLCHSNYSSLALGLCTAMEHKVIFVLLLNQRRWQISSRQMSQISSVSLQRVFYLAVSNLLLLQGTVHMTSFMINPKLKNRFLFHCFYWKLIPVVAWGFYKYFSKFKNKCIITNLIHVFFYITVLPLALVFLSFCLGCEYSGSELEGPELLIL